MVYNEAFSVNTQHTYTNEPHPNQFNYELELTLSNLKVEAPDFSEMLVSTRYQNPEDHG
jgi:hypothetical protein